MIWPAWLQQKAIEYWTKAEGGMWPGMQREATEALEQVRQLELAPKAERARRMPWEKRPRTGVDKSALPFAPVTQRLDEAEPRPARIKRIWRAVYDRAGRRCEWCHFGEYGELHHVLGGKDRQLLESEYTCAGICAGDASCCHEKQQASPAWGIGQALAWARRLLARAQVAGDAAGIAGWTETIDHLERKAALLEGKRLDVREG